MEIWRKAAKYMLAVKRNGFFLLRSNMGITVVLLADADERFDILRSDKNIILMFHTCIYQVICFKMRNTYEGCTIFSQAQTCCAFTAVLASFEQI